MTYLDSTHPDVKAALDRIRALQELTQATGVKTNRTVNEILVSLPPDVLMAVALELKSNRKEQTNDPRR
jgi:hypothetical protein